MYYLALIKGDIAMGFVKTKPGTDQEQIDSFLEARLKASSNSEADVHGEKSDYIRFTCTLDPKTYKRLLNETTDRKLQKKSPVVSAVIRDAVAFYLDTLDYIKSKEAVNTRLMERKVARMALTMTKTPKQPEMPGKPNKTPGSQSQTGTEPWPGHKG
jgi:hypothetical protein